MKKIFYKILTAVTIVAPSLIYIFLSATLFNVKPTHKVELGKGADIILVEYPDRVFYYSSSHDIKYYGNVEYNRERQIYGVYLFEGDLIQVNNELFVLEKNVDKQTLELNEISRFKIQTKDSVSLPIAFIISFIGVGIVSLVVGGKMNWFKKHKRLGVLISLALGTGVLYLINMVVGNLFNVFIIATVSWGIYYLEYLALNNFKGDNEVDELKNAFNNLMNK